MSNDYSALYETHLQSLPLVARGKVRDIYAVGSDHLLIVTTDRLSAFDVILPDPVPGKGAILTAVSNFWFARMRHVIPNHLADMTLEEAAKLVISAGLVTPPTKEEREAAQRKAQARRDAVNGSRGNGGKG